MDQNRPQELVSTPPNSKQNCKVQNLTDVSPGESKHPLPCSSPHPGLPALGSQGTVASVQTALCCPDDKHRAEVPGTNRPTGRPHRLVSTEDTSSRMETVETGMQPALQDGCISKHWNLKYGLVDRAYETWRKTAYEEL